MVTLIINGIEIPASEGSTVAVALMSSGAVQFRRSVTGEPRGALCGMGVCFECRVTIDGLAHQRSCMRLVEDGMEVATGE